MSKTKIILYSTSCPTTLKGRTDITKIKHILDTKKIEYEEVDLSEHPHRRKEMLNNSDNNITIPQVHVNGRFIGIAEDIQEFEDFGELNEILKEGTSPAKVIAASVAAATAAFQKQQQLLES